MNKKLPIPVDTELTVILRMDEILALTDVLLSTPITLQSPKVELLLSAIQKIGVVTRAASDVVQKGELQSASDEYRLRTMNAYTEGSLVAQNGGDESENPHDSMEGNTACKEAWLAGYTSLVKNPGLGR